MLESIIQSLREKFTTPEAIMREDEARWVKHLGGRTLAERLVEDKSRREDLSKALTRLGNRIGVFYPPRTTIVLATEEILGTPFYSLTKREHHLVRRFPFAETIINDIVSVSLGNRPSMDYDPELLPGNDWAAAVEKEHTWYIQCEIYDEGLNVMTRNVIDLFAQEHGYTPDVVHYHERFRDSHEDTPK